MTSRLYIFTFGWSPEFVIQPLIREGVSSEDYVLLLTSKPESVYSRKRFNEAYQSICSFLRLAGLPNNVSYVEVELEKDFIDICIDIGKSIKEYVLRVNPEVIKAYLSGGMRLLVVATLTALRFLYFHGLRMELYISREDRPVTYDVPIEVFTFSPLDITDMQLWLLKTIRGLGEASYEDLAIGRSSVTIRKTLTKLRSKGLVECLVRERKHVHRLTPLGRLVTDLLGW